MKADPKLRALAELVHQIRPTWDRAGILSVLTSDAREFTTLAHVAIDVAHDTKARTPGVIPSRDRTQVAPINPPTPTPAKACRQCSRVHDPEQVSCKVPNADRAQEGASRARQALARAFR